jgi:pantothenate kinase
VTGASIAQDCSPLCDTLGEGRACPGRSSTPSIFLPHQREYVSHIALDIGGSLVKLAYFVPNLHDSGSNDGGKLRFEKFETSRIEECLEFIERKRLHKKKDSSQPIRVKATGGGAFKYADVFRERLGIILEREDEMACVVAGCNFLLQAVRNEAFEYDSGELSFVDIEPDTMYPYLLVNIGSGVSMVRVDNENSFDRVSGTNMGGGTFWGLARLLTGCTSFDEILQLSSHGDNSRVDMLVGDIYGGRDYTSIGLSADTIASSFGKILHSDKKLEDYDKADIAMSLCRMISYNIGQLAYFTATIQKCSRVFFGGFFIRGHPYTMEIISYAIKFWSQGGMSAMFLRHEGFLGAMGAFMRVQAALASPLPKVRARFVEKFDTMTINGSTDEHLHQDDAVSGSNVANSKWMDKFIETAQSATAAAKSEHDLAVARKKSAMDLRVGVLHFTPTSEPFPLLSQLKSYQSNTLDIRNDPEEMAYWIGILQSQIPTVMEKAASSQGNTTEAWNRAALFGESLASRLSKYRDEAQSAVDRVELSDLFEVREECLREAGFHDVYKLNKDRENAAAIGALHELLEDLDRLEPSDRFLCLIQGALAANIFDWGSKACVDLYHTATILDMYRDARARLTKRPWRVDELEKLLSKCAEGSKWKIPYRRTIIFVDNAGADIVLGIIPLARELLRGGGEVVLAANSLPAINDITYEELENVIDSASQVCPIIEAARNAGRRSKVENGGRVPPPPGMEEMERAASVSNLVALMTNDAESAEDAADSKETGGDSVESKVSKNDGIKNEPKLYLVPNGQGSPCLDLNRVSRSVADVTVGTDLVIFQGMGRAIHTNYRAVLACDSLKIAMVKNQRLAEKLFEGNVYDCVLRFDNGTKTIN